MRNVLAIVMFLYAVCLAAGPACAENSGLTEDEALSLNERDYRNEINSSEKCIVLYYRNDIKGTSGSDDVIRALRERLPEDVRFFKVDLMEFSVEELELIAQNDIGKKVVPCIIPYKNGYTIRGKVIGTVKKEWFNKILDFYSKQYK
jgi:hypothetical protein